MKGKKKLVSKNDGILNDDEDYYLNINSSLPILHREKCSTLNRNKVDPIKNKNFVKLKPKMIFDFINDENIYYCIKCFDDVYFDSVSRKNKRRDILRKVLHKHQLDNVDKINNE